MHYMGLFCLGAGLLHSTPAKRRFMKDMLTAVGC
jgi:hypothetical protein